MVKQGYSPHEQYATDGRHQGPWSDFYAFGATLYRAVTGRPPDEATLRVVEDQLIPVGQAARGTYRPDFLKAVNSCLKIRPSERPQNVAQLRTMLLAPREAGSGSATRSLPDNLRTALQVARRSILNRLHLASLLWILGVAIASIALMFGVYEYGWRNSEPQRNISGKSVEISAISTPEPEPPPSVAPPPPPTLPDAFSSLFAGSGQSARDQLTDGSECRFLP